MWCFNVQLSELSWSRADVKSRPSRCFSHALAGLMLISSSSPTFPQDDIQIVINQQLRSQQQSELPPKKSTPNGMSFFRRPSRTVSTWTKQASSSSSTYSPDSIQDKGPSQWRDWLRRGKGAQYGKWWTVNGALSSLVLGKGCAKIVGQLFRRHLCDEKKPWRHFKVNSEQPSHYESRLVERALPCTHFTHS